MTDNVRIPLQLQLVPVIDEITHGMDLKKCRKCGCMEQALNDAETAFAQSDDEARQWTQATAR